MREGFSRPVYWLLMLVFLVTSGLTIFWICLYVRDAWIRMESLVAGRFDEEASLGITSGCLALVALPAGLLWRYYKNTDSYGSPLELFFSITFALCCALAALPAIF